MTSKVVPYKQGFGPFAPEVYRTPAPYTFRGVSEDDAIAALKHLFKGDVDPHTVACAVLEPVQGEGGFIPMTPNFPKRLQELLDHYGILYVNDEVQSGCGRTGPVWAIEHYGVEAGPDGQRQDARRRATARRGDRLRRDRRRGPRVRDVTAGSRSFGLGRRSRAAKRR